MIKKLKITENQLELIINHINESNEKPIGFLTEDIVTEGWKDVVLGTAMLLGLGLTGQNKAIAQNALSNTELLQQIKATLEDERIGDVADSLESSGLSNAMDKIEKNANKIEQKFNERAFRIEGVKGGLRIFKEKEVKTDTVSTYEALVKKMKAGYAISGIDQDTIKRINIEKFPQDKVIDSLSIEVNVDGLFTTALFTLSDEGKQTIKQILDGIHAQDGVVVGVRVESSTDKEPIKMGNQKLATLRADAIEKVFLDLGIPDSLIAEPIIKPEQGPDVYSTTMSNQERKAAREETSEYRYVKVYIDAIKITDKAPKDLEIKTEEDVIVYNFALVKVKEKSFDIRMPEFGKSPKTKTKKGKCNSMSCPTF